MFTKGEVISFLKKNVNLLLFSHMKFSTKLTLLGKGNSYLQFNKADKGFGEDRLSRRYIALSSL